MKWKDLKRMETGVFTPDEYRKVVATAQRGIIYKLGFIILLVVVVVLLIK